MKTNKARLVAVVSFVLALGISLGVYLLVFAGHSVSTTALSFTATAGGPNPPAQSFTFSGPATCDGGTVTVNQPWMSVSPTTLPDYTTASSTSITVFIDVITTGLAAGSYTGTVTVDPIDTQPPTTEPCDAPLTVSVTLTVTAVPPPPLTLTLGGGCAPSPYTAGSGAVLSCTLTYTLTINTAPDPGTSVKLQGGLTGDKNFTIGVSCPGAVSCPIDLSKSRSGSGNVVTATYTGTGTFVVTATISGIPTCKAGGSVQPAGAWSAVGKFSGTPFKTPYTSVVTVSCI